MKTFLWLTFTLVNLLTSQLLATSYIHQNVQGSLIENSQFKFSVYSNHCKGVIFYAIDSNGTILLIEVGNGTFINIKYLCVKSVRIRKEIINICNTHDCSKVFMVFHVELYLSQVKVICRSKSTLLQFENFIDFGHSNLYPKPIFRSPNETFIMMGNTGPYQGRGNLMYSDIQNQLSGCLIKFQFNDQVIKFIQNGSEFSKLCLNEYNGTMCNKELCTFQSISYDVDDCSLSALNPRYCVYDLPVFNGVKSSYSVNTVNRSDVLLRLEWKSLFPNNYCLLDIKFRNRTKALVHINSTGALLITVTHQQSIIKQKYVTQISFDRINILLVNFTYTKFIVKVSSKEKIDSFIDESIGEPISLILGDDSTGGICKRFQGAMKIRGEYLNAIGIPVNDQGFHILQIALMLSAAVIIVFIGILIFNKKKSVKKNANNLPGLEESDLNLYTIVNTISLPIHIVNDSDLIYETVKE